MADSGALSGSLARWGPTLWLSSGAIGIVYASLFGMEVFVDTYPAIRGYIGPVMNLLAFVALLGLAPVVADSRRRLARAGGVLAALATVGSVIAVAESVGLVSFETWWFLPSQFLLVILGMTLAFLAIGVATLSSERYSRRLGLLLLVPALIMGLNVGIGLSGYASPEGRLLVTGLFAVTYLAIGVTVRTETGRGGHSQPTSATTAR